MADGGGGGGAGVSSGTGVVAGSGVGGGGCGVPRVRAATVADRGAGVGGGPAGACCSGDGEGSGRRGEARTCLIPVLAPEGGTDCSPTEESGPRGVGGGAFVVAAVDGRPSGGTFEKSDGCSIGSGLMPMSEPIISIEPTRDMATG